MEKLKWENATEGSKRRFSGEILDDIFSEVNAFCHKSALNNFLQQSKLIRRAKIQFSKVL